MFAPPSPSPSPSSSPFAPAARRAHVALAAVLLALIACDGEHDVAADTGPSEGRSATTGGDRATARARPTTLNLDVIWIAHAGIDRGATPFGQDPSARSVARARALAADTRARLIADPAGFADVARAVSDDVYSRQLGGAMGTMPLDAVPPDLATAAAALEPGQLSPVVETPHGLYLLHRRPDVADQRVSAATILVTWTGAGSLITPRAPRSKLEARRLAGAIRAEAAAHPDRFVALVHRHSDDRDRILQDGWEGVWSSVATPLENFYYLTQATLAIEIGDVAPVIEGADGYYVVRRLPATEPPVLGASEILVSYAGARFAGSAVRSVTRSRAAAAALAGALVDQLRAAPASFDARLAELSDSPTVKWRGRRTWTKGRMQAAIDAAVERAAIGEIVGPVETPLGFSVLRRERPGAGA